MINIYIFIFLLFKKNLCIQCFVFNNCMSSRFIHFYLFILIFIYSAILKLEVNWDGADLMTTREMLLFNSCFTGKVNSVALLINKVISTMQQLSLHRMVNNYMRLIILTRQLCCRWCRNEKSERYCLITDKNRLDYHYVFNIPFKMQIHSIIIELSLFLKC